VEIRTLDPDDVDAAHDLWSRAFGPSSPDAGRARRAAEAGRILAVYDGTRVAAVGEYHAFE
jgi:hypothetical protein